MEFKWDVLCEIIQESLADFSVNDVVLLELNANERSVSHKFAEYFRRHLDKRLTPDEQQYFSVDCEYNRSEDKPKKLAWRYSETDQEDASYYTPNPDVILHHRTNSDANVLVVEMKVDGNANPGKVLLDKQKLASYVDEPLFYSFGLFLCLGHDNHHVVISEAHLVERKMISGSDSELRWRIRDECLRLLAKELKPGERAKLKRRLDGEENDRARALIQELERSYGFRDVTQEVDPHR